MLGVLGGHVRFVIAATAGYIVAVRVLVMVVRRTRQAGDMVIGATMFSDLAFVFATTIASSPDGHYYRILILSVFVLHAAEAFFGRRHAVIGLTAVIGGYLAMTGGEEFTVILPDTDADGAYHSGMRICETVRTHAFMVNGKRLHLTISVGIVSSTAIGGDAVGTNLKEHADEALYTAKRAGRDRVSVWDESLPLTLTPIHMMVVPAKSRL